MPLITIRGQLGSGAPEIGRAVADRLGVDYVDQKIIAEVATRLHRHEEEVIEKEMPPSSLLGRISEALDHGVAYGMVYLEGAYLPVWEIPLDDTGYLQALESVVRELARSQSLVIQGRGSQFILREYPQAFHVQAVASLEVRVKRIMQDRKLNQEIAKQEIARFDNGSHRFVKRYFQAEVEDPVNYDLVINTERLSFEAAASIVVDALAVKEGTSGGQSRAG
jgi:cytidylate kinase